MSHLAVPENHAISPTQDESFSPEMVSGSNLPFGRSVPTVGQMRTRVPWTEVRTAQAVTDEHSRTDSSGLDSQDIEKALQKVRAEAEEERSLDPELDAIQETVYKDVDRFLRTLYASDYGTIGRFVSLADIMPLDNGEIGLEWREGEKIFTLSFGGDEHIVFAGIFSKESKARGILTFSTAHFFAIIGMVTSLYTQL